MNKELSRISLRFHAKACERCKFGSRKGAKLAKNEKSSLGDLGGLARENSAFPRRSVGTRNVLHALRGKKELVLQHHPS
ncbi:MAG: hypothetical protein SWH68_15925 [Thermodesulfobacteriota bacterium]|nr:hypothetical protein [Thermodesulfobacteriota bacterium]